MSRRRPFARAAISMTVLSCLPILLCACPKSGGGGGGGSTGGSSSGTPSAGLDGEWSYQATTNNECFGEPGYEEQDTAQIAVSGTAITFTFTSFELSGTVNGSTISVSGSDTLYDHDMTLQVSSSGNTISGIDNWGFSFGPACFGSSNILLQR